MLKELTQVEAYLIVVSFEEMIKKDPYSYREITRNFIKHSVGRLKELATYEWGTRWFEEIERNFEGGKEEKG